MNLLDQSKAFLEYMKEKWMAVKVLQLLILDSYALEYVNSPID